MDVNKHQARGYFRPRGAYKYLPVPLSPLQPSSCRLVSTKLVFVGRALMETAIVSSSSSGLVGPSDLRLRSGVLSLNRPNCAFFRRGPRLVTQGIKHSRTSSPLNHGLSSPLLRFRKGSTIRASLDGSSGSSDSFAPLQLESPIGQFLSRILISHPHLLPAAVEQQLEQLKTDQEAEKDKEVPSPTGSELVLYRRIAEVKAKERKRTLEEIVYALIVQKFMDADVPLFPTVSQASDPNGRVGQWSSEEEKLERLHSPEACEMIQNHLRLILGQRLGDSSSVASISKLRVGQVYAASIMYGYFLKRVDQRFQLDKSMRTLPWSSDVDQTTIKQVMPEESQSSEKVDRDSQPDDSKWSLPTGSPGGFGFGIKPTPFRTYIMSLDAETLQRYATIRSKEAFSIIEKHTEALFGRPEIVITPQGTIDNSKDELIKMSFAGLRRLILEAVTFGSMLWDAESYVDARYHFMAT